MRPPNCAAVSLQPVGAAPLAAIAPSGSKPKRIWAARRPPAAPPEQRRDVAPGIFRPGAGIQLERQAGRIERNAVESARDRVSARPPLRSHRHRSTPAKTSDKPVAPLWRIVRGPRHWRRPARGWSMRWRICQPVPGMRPAGTGFACGSFIERLGWSARRRSCRPACGRMARP